MVGELRVLSRIQNAAQASPLAVAPALLANPGDHAKRLRALVTTYARAERMVRLTVMGQSAESAAFAWIMRGIHKGDAGWDPISIPEAHAQKQTVLDGGGDTIYEITPSTDTPIARELSQRRMPRSNSWQR